MKKMEINEIEKMARTSMIKNIILVAAIFFGFSATLFGTWDSTKNAKKKTIEAAKFEARANELSKINEKIIESERLLSDGIELASRGRLTDAITSYNKAIELNPQSANAYQFLGYALLRRSQIKPKFYPNDLKDSISALEKAIQIDPTHVWAHYNMALAYWEAGKKDMAIDMVRRVLEIGPSFKDVLANDVQFKHFWKSSEFRKLLQIP